MIFISDLIKPPFDEGAKVVAKNLLEQLEGAGLAAFSVITGCICSMSTIAKLIMCKTDYILYFPSQSATFNTFIRAKLINLVSRRKVVLLSTQPREYSKFQKRIIRVIQPYKIFVQSGGLKNELINIGLTNVFINFWGVDTVKFVKVNQDIKNRLRNKFNIPLDKKVYLHFGHLNKGRNFDELELVLRSDKSNYVLIVCSTTTDQKKELKKQLLEKGFNFMVEYIENNQELYQLADYYVFPTINRMSAIEFPLSVFEALSCGIPVYCKSFGYLKDLKGKKYSNIKYYDQPQDLLQDRFSLDNPVPIENYTWGNSVKQLLQQIEE